MDPYWINSEFSLGKEGNVREYINQYKKVLWYCCSVNIVQFIWKWQAVLLLARENPSSENISRSSSRPVLSWNITWTLTGGWLKRDWGGRREQCQCQPLLSPNSAGHCTGHPPTPTPPHSVVPGVISKIFSSLLLLLHNTQCSNFQLKNIWTGIKK